MDLQGNYFSNEPSSLKNCVVAFWPIAIQWTFKKSNLSSFFITIDWYLSKDLNTMKMPDFETLTTQKVITYVPEEKFNAFRHEKDYVCKPYICVQTKSNMWLHHFDQLHLLNILNFKLYSHRPSKCQRQCWCLRLCLEWVRNPFDFWSNTDTDTDTDTDTWYEYCH